MDIINEHKAAKKAIAKKRKELELAESNFRKIDDTFKRVVGTTTNGINTKKTKSSLILTNINSGYSIMLPARSSNHSERKVFEHDGKKKTTCIATNSRGSINEWKTFVRNK